MNTNKELLVRGIRMMVITAIFMFMGPTIIYQAFKNQEHLLFYPVLVLGIFFSILAVLVGFKGLNTIMNSVFGKRNKK